MRLAKYVAEGIGTFCLVFFGTASIVINEINPNALTHLGIALSFGLVVLAMVYAIGHLSGAHMNPAVTLGFVSIGRMPLREAYRYIVAQLAGAVLASALVCLVFGKTSARLGMTIPAGSLAQSFILEFIMSAALMFVIVSVATDHRAQGVMAGVAIGATICLEAMVGGLISGASMNPARSLAPALISWDFSQQWIYLVSPIMGVIAGAHIYRAVRCESGSATDANGCC